ncbi:ABC transporter permease [Chitinophaga pendula]|uniref:ABC transporter permease n=1 Tax=Chitinophaga TaxID=79328 RepID=UPI000BAF0801|nr:MULTISPECIES: ABC transporter permease [Chitinophaga]ASZ09528.1 hypothetical protein CK934_00315 [Chitinophaga sp. MD30]UCJ07538.1 ABC transporter permease [Chitinophaga pendula]
MKNLLSIEWQKVKHYRTFWILLFLSCAIIPATNYVVHNVTDQMLQKAQGLILQNPYDFPLVWQTVANVSSFVNILFGLLLVILITNEFTYRTHRQHIIDGMERRDFVWGKVYWIGILTAIALLIALATAAGFGLAYGTHPLSLESMQYMAFYTLQLLVSLSIALLIALLIKRAGLAIVLYLAYCFVIEQILVVIVKRIVGQPGGLLPLQAGDELLPFPVIDKFIPTPRYQDGVYMAALIIYLAVFLWIAFRRMQRADL